MSKRHKTPTLAERLVAGLKVLGYREEVGRSRKYRVFVCPSGHKETMHVGKAGALRSGRSQAASVSLAETRIYGIVLRAGDIALADLADLAKAED